MLRKFPLGSKGGTPGPQACRHVFNEQLSVTCSFWHIDLRFSCFEYVKRWRMFYLIYFCSLLGTAKAEQLIGTECMFNWSNLKCISFLFSLIREWWFSNKLQLAAPQLVIFVNIVCIHNIRFIWQHIPSPSENWVQLALLSLSDQWLSWHLHRHWTWQQT